MFRNCEVLVGKFLRNIENKNKTITQEYFVVMNHSILVCEIRMMTCYKDICKLSKKHLCSIWLRVER